MRGRESVDRRRVRQSVDRRRVRGRERKEFEWEKNVKEGWVRRRRENEGKESGNKGWKGG